MKSIALKLWLGMMALVSIVLVLLWLFQIVFLGRFYSNIRISDIKKEGYEIIKLFDKGDYKEFEQKVDAFTYNNNAVIDIVDLNSKTLYTNNTTSMHGHMSMSMGMGMGMMKNKVKNEVYNQALEGKEELAYLSNPQFGTKSALIGLPITISGQQEGVFLIELPMAPVESTVGILKRQLLYIIPILLVASLVLSFAISRSFTRPVLDIIKVTEKMAGGDLDARVEKIGKDEIGRLATTINDMGGEIAKTDKLRKDLIANVSHELRTPLSLIKGYAETIRDISGDFPEKRERHVQIMIEESDRLSRIVDDILNLSQMQAGYVHLDLETFSLNNLIEHAIKKYEIEKEKRDIEIHFEKREDFLVIADEDKIRQVLYNLIDNALNHSPVGDVVTILLVPKEKNIKIYVINNGELIPQDQIKYIWDRFYKADKSGKRSMAGTGIGLSIVKNILMAHGFNYGVESNESTGTAFWFEIKGA